jgi:hypothetical protein
MARSWRPPIARGKALQKMAMMPAASAIMWRRFFGHCFTPLRPVGAHDRFALPLHSWRLLRCDLALPLQYILPPFNAASDLACVGACTASLSASVSASVLVISAVACVICFAPLFNVIILSATDTIVVARVANIEAAIIRSAKLYNAKVFAPSMRRRFRHFRGPCCVHW